MSVLIAQPPTEEEEECRLIIEQRERKKHLRKQEENNKSLRIKRPENPTLLKQRGKQKKGESEGEEGREVDERRGGGGGGRGRQERGEQECNTTGYTYRNREQKLTHF